MKTLLLGILLPSYKWYFVTIIPAKDESRIAKGQRLRLDFKDYGFASVPVVVESLLKNDASGNLIAEFKCENINADILRLRVENANIVLKSEKGIKVDKKALHIVDGHNGVFVRFGNMIYFRKIEILLEEELQYLVKDYKDTKGEWIQLYDEVVVDAGGRALSDKQII